jgi:hypothetical protein
MCHSVLPGAGVGGDASYGIPVVQLTPSLNW